MGQVNNKMRTWIDALLSGDYKQGHGVLYSTFNDSYCCLGVADVAVFGATFDENGIDDLGDYSFLASNRAGQLNLNKQATEEEMRYLHKNFRISTVNDERQNILAAINDSGEVTFEDIVELIQKLGWDKN